MKEEIPMITMYGMISCPDCSYVVAQIGEIAKARGESGFVFVDIGEDVRNMKRFIRLRDTAPAFDSVRGSGSIGIPCFVREDGTVTLKPEDVGLRSRESASGSSSSCRIDGKGC